MTMYEIKLTTNKMAGFATVWSAESYESAWDEFLNQIEESAEDDYIEIQLLDVTECENDPYRYKAVVLYRFVKDEICGYQNHGTLYHIDIDGDEEDCMLDGSPDMQVSSWTAKNEPKHFLTISDHFGQDIVDVETTEEIDSKYLVYCSFSGYRYKDYPLGNFVIDGKY